MEIYVTVDNIGKSEKEAIFNTRVKFIYYKISQDGRNQKMWDSEYTAEKVSKDKIRDVLKAAAEAKMVEFFKTAKPIEKVNRTGA